MHAFLALFLGQSLRAIVFRVMATLGLGVVTYGGGQILIGEVVSMWLSYANDLPPQWLAMMGYLNADRAVSLIVSAIVVRTSIKLAKKTISIKTGVSS